MTETKGTFIHRQQALHQLMWEEIKEPGAYVEVSTGNLYRVWEEIKEPGAYVEMSAGNLNRVPREYLPKGTSRFMHEPGGPTSPLVLLSKDPFIFALAARMICFEHNIQPSF
jgi:hypothetical protein